MSDSNNNAYDFGYDVSKKTDDIIEKMRRDEIDDESAAKRIDFTTPVGSVESLATYGMKLNQSSDDESAFMSDDSSVASQRALQARRDFHNPRYTRSMSRSSSRSSQSNRSSISSRSNAHSKVTIRSRRNSKRGRKTSNGDLPVFNDVIHENEEVTSYQRSNSNPLMMNRGFDERKSRLVRRRSAVTFASTYRTLSAPPRLIPIRPSLGSLVVSTTPSIASVASVQDPCCYGGFPRSFGRQGNQTSWSNLMTCLAHRKENGFRMTPTQIMIRKSLEKAIQKAGYNMNELALSNSPCSSPINARKMAPKSIVDWTESAMIGEHIWAPSNQAGDLCYVGEALCKKSGPRKKCSACHIVVHDVCLDQLDKIGFQCKVTFREASTRNLRENLVVRHHWVHRRRQEGKCKHCGKAFEKRFGFRDSKILAISCSWCKDAYHNKVSCFQMQKINEACTLGVHARIIVPPTWIVKWTPRGKSVRNRSKKKRGSSGMWKKKSSREGRKLFVIRPLPEHTPYLSPTLVFINPKSGGNQGFKILQAFQWLLNQRQVFNLSDGGPKEALEMFRKVQNLRILACGGDGTVGWILSTLDELNLSTYPPVAVLPLGTGNDLARTLNWGSAYTDEPISKILQHVEEGRVVQVDRWKLSVKPNPDAVKVDEESEGVVDVGVDQPPLSVVNNYFSLGADAKVVLEFHESREAHPSKFNSRMGNMFFYARTGVTDYLTAKHKNVGKSVTVVCDGKDITAKIQASKPVCLVFLNIPRYSAGTQPWGTPTGSEFEPQRHDDKLIEVLALNSNQLGLLYVGGHGERLCQCREAVITTSRVFPIQIDGEPCRLNPSIIKLTLHNQANMIYKTKRGSIPLIPDFPFSEQLKICINTITLDQYEKYNGDKQKLRELSKPSHATVVASDADLQTVRLSIERMQQQQDKSSTEGATDQYTFLDLSSSGDRFYRIDRTQESLHLVKEVATSDGEIFVLDSNVRPSSTVPTAPTSELDPSLGLNSFPRSQLVDRTTRRRIRSDTTGSSFRQNSMPDPGLTPNREELERSMTNKFELRNDSEFVKEEKDISDVTKHGDDVTKDTKVFDVTKNPEEKENVEDQSHIDKKEEKPLGASSGDKSRRFPANSDSNVTDEVKRNSLPASLTKREPGETVQTRPLSYSSHDVSGDVISTQNSSKPPTHCDINKAESYGSVFSSPNSSRRDSLKRTQESEEPLCGGVATSTKASAERLVVAGSGDQVPTMTSSDVAIMSTSPPREMTTSSGLHSPESPTSRESPISSGSRSNSLPQITSPTIILTDDDGAKEHEGYNSSSNHVTSHEDAAKLAHHAISRKSDTRYSMSTIPSPRIQSPNIKARANTTAGMPLSIFVKTQTPPPTDKLISPMKRRTTSRSVSPEADRSVTLHEFVSSMKEDSTTNEKNTDSTTPPVKTPMADNTKSANSTPNQDRQQETPNGNPEDDDQHKLNKQYGDSAKRGDLAKLKMALESGADPLSQDSDGTTALHNAARFNHPDVVTYLIEHGPPELLNQNDRDRQQTPLHKAAWFGHKKVCEILVNAGASLTSMDYKGMTPLQRAQQAEDTKLEAFLAQQAVKRMQEASCNEDKETKL